MNGSTEGVLFGLAFRWSDDPRNPGGIVAETFGDGMSRPLAAAYLRLVARGLERAATADGEELFGDIGT